MAETPSPLPPKAMVLAAGLGTRMRPLTDDRPKPLVPVLGRPLIDRVLDRLAEAGIAETVVNIHYKGAMLRDHLASRRTAPRIRISDETDALLDTGGGVVKALPLLGGAPFVTYNADSIWLEANGPNIPRLIERFDSDTMDALMLIVPLVNCCGFDGRGDFTMDADGRLAWRPKGGFAPFAWTGVQMVSPRLFRDPPHGAFSTRILWDRAMAEGRLFGLRLDGYWMHVGTPQGVLDAEDRLREAGENPAPAREGP
ncbi:MAG: nucleotidyltransferase family protein [Alphaproteobacteria bacterium]